MHPGLVGFQAALLHLAFSNKALDSLCHHYRGLPCDFKVGSGTIQVLRVGRAAYSLIMARGAVAGSDGDDGAEVIAKHLQVEGELLNVFHYAAGGGRAIFAGELGGVEVFCEFHISRL